MDVASAAQIDSLPGVTPLMAKRIVTDRMARGPFLSADGLRRVIGVGSGFLKHVDTLITFSGTFVQGSASDTILPKRRRGRGNK
jgi:competence protein ComEA